MRHRLLSFTRSFFPVSAPTITSSHIPLAPILNLARLIIVTMLEFHTVEDLGPVYGRFRVIESPLNYSTFSGFLDASHCGWQPVTSMLLISTWLRPRCHGIKVPSILKDTVCILQIDLIVTIMAITRKCLAIIGYLVMSSCNFHWNAFLYFWIFKSYKVPYGCWSRCHLRST